MKENQKDKIIGIVDRIIFHNRDNGYYILSVELSNDENVTATAYHPNLHEGLTYEFVGDWIQHSRYGKQIKCNSIFEVAPNTKEGLRAYLSSSFFPGIGPVISKKIVDYFKDDVIRIFNHDIDRLLEVPGISPKKLEAIKKSWEDNEEINDVMMFLQQFGISTVYAAKIYKHYGRGCVQKIKENPYTLARDISGIGFKYADKVALEVGIEADSEERIRACIMHILESGSLDGHCYLIEEQITLSSTELLGVDIRDRVSNILKYMIQDRDIMLYEVNDEPGRYYSKKLYYNEKLCANVVGEFLLKNKKFHKKHIKIESDKLSEEQKRAVIGVLSNKISLLYGGPGCGKTFCSQNILIEAEKMKKDIVICCPTGKAAMRSTQVTGYEAMTIHRLLSYNPETKGFMYNENNKLPFNFIVIEESSMIDIILLSYLLRAIHEDAQIVFIGDDAQLPPISPGIPFKNMIESNVIPKFELTKIFRQANNSCIIKAAHDIRRGVVPQLKSPFIEPELWTNKNVDCMFIDSGTLEVDKDKTNYPKWSSLRYGKDIVDMIKILFLETIKKYYETDDIQILIPMKVSNLGSNRINKELQEILNPLKNSDIEICIGDRKFRKNDKVIQTQNQYELGGGVFNGEIGKITSITLESCNVQFEDGRVIEYKKIDMIDLEHAWALSIHKFQGSECSCVIIPIAPVYNKMLERSLIYTGISRGKKLVVFVGERKSLEKSIKTIKSEKRQTSLKELLIETDFVNSMSIQN